MTVEYTGSSLAVEGATDREVFEAYVEKILVPSSLLAEQVTVIENLSAHKGERVRELIFPAPQIASIIQHPCVDRP
jgi:hypothetical protein